jgi:hypothetical protein
MRAGRLSDFFRKLASRLALVVAGSLLGLALGEVVVRALGRGDVTLDRGRLHAFDPEAGWICQPGANLRYELPESFAVRVRCNSRGLRDVEHAFEKPAGVLRIVCSGDSFMWGYGVEDDETFPSCLSRALGNAETINLGVSGYNTVQEYVRLESEGMRYGPDWVVFFVCWNDLDANFDDKGGRRPIAALSPDGGVRIENRPVHVSSLSTLSDWISRHSRLYIFASYGIKLTRDLLLRRHAAEALAVEARDGGESRRRRAPASGSPMSIAAQPPAPAPARDEGASSDGAADEMAFSELELFAGTPRPALTRAWEALRRLLALTRDLVQSHGARLLIVYAVDLTNVEESVQNELARAARLPRTDMDWDRPNRTLGEICASLGVAYVDPTPDFRARPSTASLFLRGNRHWSAAGQKLMADVVARRLRALQGP